jgi:galactokinase
MNGDELIQCIEAPGSKAIFEKLYGAENINNERRRYIKLAESFMREFSKGSDGIRVFTAAGRTELGGNHTDHNHGKVLAASIQLDQAAVVMPRGDKKVLFRSTGFPDVYVDISNLEPREDEKGTTEALLRGIAAQFVNRGIRINGFTANANSTVLPGSGLSSSASVEVLFGSIFNHLYNRGQFLPIQIAQFGQKAENEYFGKPSGLMDQAASALGGVVAIDFKDMENPVIERIHFNPTSFGFVLCIVDTRGSHVNLTPDYAAIPQEMKAVAHFLGKETLREISLKEVIVNAEKLRESTGDRSLLRSFHYFNENRRVDEMVDALKKTTVGSEGGRYFQNYMHLVNESGNSSWELLQNVFSPQHPSAQGISLALALTREFFKVDQESSYPIAGACRVHGGGFAGAIQAYMPRKHLEAYKTYMEKVFGPNVVTVLQIRPVGTSELLF